MKHGKKKILLSLQICPVPGWESWKKPDLKYRVKEEDLKELAGLQRKILENAQAMVKRRYII